MTSNTGAVSIRYESLYDIGPMPWDDGVVDAQDVLVLAENMVQNTADPNDPNDL